MDVWMPCQDFPKYLVSPEGLIMNRERDALLKTRQNDQGIVMVNLSRDGKRHTVSVPRLVAQAYLQPPKKSYNSVIQLDGDRINCNASNLMWRPRWYAVRYHQMFSNDRIDISVLVEDTGEVFGTLWDFCVKYGLDQNLTYMDLLNGDKCFHYGYRLKRVSGY